MHYFSKCEDLKLLEVKLGQTKQDYESHINQLIMRYLSSALTAPPHFLLLHHVSLPLLHDSLLRHISLLLIHVPLLLVHVSLLLHISLPVLHISLLLLHASPHFTASS